MDISCLINPETVPSHPFIWGFQYPNIYTPPQSAIPPVIPSAILPPTLGQQYTKRPSKDISFMFRDQPFQRQHIDGSSFITPQTIILPCDPECNPLESNLYNHSIVSGSVHTVILNKAKEVVQKIAPIVSELKFDGENIPFVSHSLPLPSTTYGSTFYIKSTISYRTIDGITKTQDITSTRFILYKKRGQVNLEPPVLNSIKNEYGPHNEDTEIWIKCKGLTEQIIVLLDLDELQVTEKRSNFIVAVVPKRPYLTTNTIAHLSVANVYWKDGDKNVIVSLTSCQFTYTVNDQYTHKQ